jgi:putative tricarboxylic transport membrane protein
MRTAKQKRVVAFRTYLRTLLHEVGHHVDYTLLGLRDSFHTEGFYKRESTLSNALIALMAGAMMIHGIAPGPQVMTKQPELYWGLIASMWFGNLMLVIINLPLVGLWVRLLRVPYRILFPSIIVFCCIGIYSIDNSASDVIIAALFGLFGYWLMKHDFEPAPLVLAFVLGPLMEDNLRRAMLIARGDTTVFVTRPISAVLIAISVALLTIAILPMIRKRREEVFVESEN